MFANFGFFNNFSFFLRNPELPQSPFLKSFLKKKWTQLSCQDSHFYSDICDYFPSLFLEFLVIDKQRRLLSCVVSQTFFLDFCFWIKYFSGLSFKSLVDIVAVDNLPLQPRFFLVYNFLSIKRNFRFFVSLSLNHIPYLQLNDQGQSLTHEYPSAGWLEREVWDLFGIIFQNNNDLRRILTDYGFIGFPLRKDYPLIGYNELFFDLQKQYLYYAPTSLAQDFRHFTYESPWNSLNA